MKKMTLSAALFSVIIACNKSADGNKSVLKENSEVTTISNENGVTDSASASSSSTEIDGKTTQKEETRTYKASNGNRANVVIFSSPKENTMTIRANGQKYVLDKKSETKYERNSVNVEIKGDSLFIVQGDNVIELVRDL